MAENCRPTSSGSTLRLILGLVLGLANARRECMLLAPGVSLRGPERREKMTSRANTEEIWDAVDAKKVPFQELSDRVWAMPELCFGEFRSAAEHKQLLEAEGF